MPIILIGIFLRKNMAILILIFLTFISSLQTLFCSLFEKKYAGLKNNASSVFCVIEGLFVPVLTLVWICFEFIVSENQVTVSYVGLNFDISLFGIIVGIINAVVLFSYNTYLIKASSTGSYAFMNVLMLFGGIIIPILYTALFFYEKISFYQIFAIFLMLVAFVLMNYKDIKLKGTPLKYYIYCLILFFANGAYGTLLKVQSNHNESEVNEMIIITYLLMGVLAFLKLVFTYKKDTFKVFIVGKQAIMPLILCIVCVALAMNVIALVLPLIDASVFYTVNNGGVLVLASIYSIMLFKEKPQFLKIIGIIIAVISIVILSIPGEIMKNIFI